MSKIVDVRGVTSSIAVVSFNFRRCKSMMYFKLVNRNHFTKMLKFVLRNYFSYFQ